MSSPIIIEEYSLQWPLIFQELKAVYESHLRTLISDIQHVGSTSVPGLAAKPVIDMDLVIERRDVLELVCRKLSALGYEYMGDFGIPDREAFRRMSQCAPDDGSGRIWPKHNLYVCLSGCLSMRNHIALRDYLRSHPDKAKEYGELKKRLAALDPNDKDGYIRNKTPFITAILGEIGFDDSEIKIIRTSNNFL